MELWKALLLFDEQTPQQTAVSATPAVSALRQRSIPAPESRIPISTLGSRPKAKPPNREFSFFNEFNQAPKPAIVPPLDLKGKIPPSVFDPQNAPQPLNSFRHNDFVKIGGHLKEFPDLERQLNSQKSGQSYGRDSSFRTGSVAIPVSEYNEAVKAPWDEKGVDLDLESVQYLPPSGTISYSEYQQYRKRSQGSAGNRSVPIPSRDGSLAPSDISAPYSDPYPGSRRYRTRQPRQRRKHYVYVPSREDAIREDAERSDSETPGITPRRVQGKPPRDYRRGRKHKSHSPFKDIVRNRSESLSSHDDSSHSGYEGRHDRRKPHRQSRRQVSEPRRNYLQRSSSHKRTKANGHANYDPRYNDKPSQHHSTSYPDDRDEYPVPSNDRSTHYKPSHGRSKVHKPSENLSKSKRQRSKKPLDRNRYIALSSRDSNSLRNHPIDRRSRHRPEDRTRQERRSANKENISYISGHYGRDNRRRSRSTGSGSTEDSESVDSSTEDQDEDEEEETDTESESQLGGDSDDDPQTNGDVTIRKGGPKGGRFEDAADGISSGHIDPREAQRQGKRATFYNFKEKTKAGCIEAISKQRFPLFDSLLNSITERLSIDKGANYIYQWPRAMQITNVEDFEPDGTYIVSSHPLKKNQIDVVYGKLGPKHWHVGKVKYNDSPLIRNPPSGQEAPSSSGKGKALIVRLFSNHTHEENVVILNTSRQFEEIMSVITDNVKLRYPPATKLFVFNNGVVGKEIRGVNQLTREIRNQDCLLVCGTERDPVLDDKPVKSRYKPSNSHSSESYWSSVKSRPKYLPTSDSAPPRTDAANGTVSPRSNGVQNGLPYDRYEPVKVNINGRRRDFYPTSMTTAEENYGKPDKKLLLHWVYGYRGSDRPRNLEILEYPDTTEMVYYVASVVVLYDRHKHMQRFFTQHNEDITCLTIHPSMRKVATGQMQGKDPDHGAHIRIWDTDSLTTLQVIGLGAFQNGIVAISFSDMMMDRMGGELMMVVDDSFRHAMSIWDLETATIITKTTTSTESVTGGCFYPFDSNILVTYGKQHLYFWAIEWDPKPRLLRDTFSGYAEDDIPTHFSSLAFAPNGDVITGDSNGSVMVWQHEGNNIFTFSNEESSFNVHKSPVTCLVPYKDGLLLSGGGNEIFMWDLSRNTSVERFEVPMTGNIQTLVPTSFHNAHYENALLYIGTDRNCVLEGRLMQSFETIIQGHFGDSAFVAARPGEPAFVSACRDQVIKWSFVSRSHMWKTKLDQGEKCTAVTISPDSRMVFVGTKSGKVYALSYREPGNVESITTFISRKINSLTFSPDGGRIAIAVDDGYLHICSVDRRSEIGRLHATSNMSGVSVTHVDWSLDSRYLQTTTSDLQLFFWNVDKKPKIILGHKLNKMDGLKFSDMDWDSQTSLLSHSILAPWQNLASGETIKSMDRSNRTVDVADHNGMVKKNYFLLVTGDNMGRLRLYKYPCPTAATGFWGSKIYSGTVNSTAFSGDDYFVFSAASNIINGEMKNHLGIMQWALVDPDVQPAEYYVNPNYPQTHYHPPYGYQYHHPYHYPHAHHPAAHHNYYNKRYQ